MARNRTLSLAEDFSLFVRVQIVPKIARSALPLNNMTAEEAKRRKTVEEVRKLTIVNDAKEGLLCRRAQVAEAMHRCHARITDARIQSETRDPLKLVGKDLPGMRDGVRGIWDVVLENLLRLAKEFDDI